MSKLTLTDVASGYQTVAASNANNAATEAAMELTLSRNGTSPNEMTANLDLNSNDILNVNALDTTTLTIAGTSVVAGSTLSVPSATSVPFTQTGTGGVLSNVGAKLNETLSPGDFGAIGNGVADDTAFVQAAMDAGGYIFVPAGTYLIDDITITTVVHVHCAAGAIFKKKTGTAANSILILFSTGSAGSVWEGGAIDGNSSTLRAGYSTANATYPGFFDGWFLMKTAAANIHIENVTFQNCVTKPAWFAGDYGIIKNVSFIDHGDAALFGWEYFGANKYSSRPTGDGAYRQKVENILSLRCDNLGEANMFQHAIDLMACEGGSFTNISIFDQDGDASGGSPYASGLTMESLQDCTFSGIKVKGMSSNDLIHLGVSMLGCLRCTFTNLSVIGNAGPSLELNACIDCSIDNFILDGEYNTTAAVPAENASSLGLTYYTGAWDTDRTSKVHRGSRNCTLSNGIMQRFTYGCFLRGVSHTLINVNIIGNLLHGIVQNEEAFATYYAGFARPVIGLSKLLNCTIVTNGKAGITAIGPRTRETYVSGGVFRNNGQKVIGASDAVSAGLIFNSGTKASVVGASIGDTQTWTFTDSASFQPHSSTASAPYLSTVVFENTGTLSLGQWVTFTGAASGPADITGKIYDIDERTNSVTVETLSAVTWVSASNLTALSGTWTGTTNTLTGVGGAANTEITGPTWVTDGSEYRLVTSAAVAGTIVLNTKFTADPSATTLNRLTIDTSGIPSQRTGIRSYGAQDKIFLASNHYDGNTVEPTTISTVTDVQPGSTYYRAATTTTNLDLTIILNDIPQGHRLLGIATNNVIAITGGTGNTTYDIELVTSAAGARRTLATGVLVAQNTKVTGTVWDMAIGATQAIDATGDDIRANFNGSSPPTAGSIRIRALFAVDEMEALPNA